METVKEEYKQRMINNNNSSLPMMSTSAVQSIADATINILHCGGSSGNSAICRPRDVSSPVLSNAPSTHN